MLELIMQLSRSGDNRLSGTVRLHQGSELHQFSGTLELMRVFEDLVPFVQQVGPREQSRGGAPTQAGASGPPKPRIP